MCMKFGNPKLEAVSRTLFGVSSATFETHLFQITNLMHSSFVLYQYIRYIIILDMFRAVLCSSSGGQIVLLQHLG